MKTKQNRYSFSLVLKNIDQQTPALAKRINKKRQIVSLGSKNHALSPKLIAEIER